MGRILMRVPINPYSNLLCSLQGSPKDSQEALTLIARNQGQNLKKALKLWEQNKTSWGKTPIEKLFYSFEKRVGKKWFPIAKYVQDIESMSVWIYWCDYSKY